MRGDKHSAATPYWGILQYHPRRHRFECRVMALARMYGIREADARDNYTYFGERMSREEVEFNDQHCSCGLVVVH